MIKSFSGQDKEEDRGEYSRVREMVALESLRQRVVRCSHGCSHRSKAGESRGKQTGGTRIKCSDEGSVCVGVLPPFICIKSQAFKIRNIILLSYLTNFLFITLGSNFLCQVYKTFSSKIQ